MHRRLRVRPEFDGAGSAPALVHDDIGQPPRRELTDRRRAVDVIDRLQIDVLAEIEMARETAQRLPPLLVGHRASENVDPVPRHHADDEIAAMIDPGFAKLLWLAMNLAPMNDADVGG